MLGPVGFGSVWFGKAGRCTDRGRGLMKRFLTQAEAERCEMAQEPVCKCRCGGAKHGAGRIGNGGDFSMLPMDDPHYRPSLSKQQVQRVLRNARWKMGRPRLVDRDSYIRQHGFEAWEQISKIEDKAYRDAYEIITHAMEAL